MSGRYGFSIPHHVDHEAINDDADSVTGTIANAYDNECLPQEYISLVQSIADASGLPVRGARTLVQVWLATQEQRKNHDETNDSTPDRDSEVAERRVRELPKSRGWRETEIE